METQESPNNVETPTEQPVATESAQAPTGPVNTTTETQPQEEQFFDPKGLSPELEPAYKQMQAAFTKKTQGLADYRKKSESLDQLVQYKPFVDWYNRHVSGTDEARKEQPAPKQPESKPPAPQGLFDDLSDEEYQLLSSDKGKFGKYMQSKIADMAAQVAGPMAQQAQQKVQYLENLSTIERFGQEHPDFWELDGKGLIEPLLEKHPGLGIEEVYKLAKFPFLQQEAVQKAHQMVSMKRNATVEQPGLGIPSAGKLKAKTREDAMNMAWEYASRGQAVPDIDIG